MTSSLVFVSQRSFESYRSQTALPVKKKNFRRVSSLWLELEANSDLSKENVEKYYLMCIYCYTEN